MHMTKLREKGCPMRYKATFLAGLAVGFVAGARAGRERYEQMVKASRKVADVDGFSAQPWRWKLKAAKAGTSR